MLWLRPSRNILVAFTATTETHARRHQKISAGDLRCAVISAAVTQHRNAKDTFATEEQPGNITMLPEPSANRTIFPSRCVPNIVATNVESKTKKYFAKNAKSTLLQSIGTVTASIIVAPRLPSDEPLVKRSW